VRKAASIALLILSTSAWAQTPQFEVASIKPSTPDPMKGSRMSGGPGTKDPGLFTCDNASLVELLLAAYDLPWYRLSGPPWMNMTRFNISARIPEGTTIEQFKLMQQNLLLDRFKMTFHHEQKQLPAYDLVVAKNGPKLKEAEPAPPEDADGPKPPRPARKLDKDGFPILPPGRAWITDMEGPRWVQRFTDATMEDLGRYVASMVGQPVDDATGLKGKYDFILKWLNQRGRRPSDDDTGPNIFEALQAQLGLKLESKKTLVDVLVIDHIEKMPTEN
jgi:uncharacterized protein (TIGR03435 family)